MAILWELHGAVALYENIPKLTIYWKLNLTFIHKLIYHLQVIKPLKGNCSGKKIIFFIPSIDRVCGSDAQEKKSDFLLGSIRRYKTLKSSTNCGCGHLMKHFVGIAITQQFIVVAFTCPGGVHC